MTSNGVDQLWTAIQSPYRELAQHRSTGSHITASLTTTTTMFVINPQSLLLVVPRNVVTAVGLPLAGGFYSGSHTAEVVRGNWYNVRTCLHSLIVHETHDMLELVLSTWETATPRFPHRLEYTICRQVKCA